MQARRGLEKRSNTSSLIFGSSLKAETWKVKFDLLPRLRVLFLQQNEKSWSRNMTLRPFEYFNVSDGASSFKITSKFFYNFGKFSRNITKNLWRKKCVRRRIFWNVEVKICPLQPLLRLRHGRSVAVRSVRGHLALKMNIIFITN